MLESYSINICVATAGHDRYDKVAINKYPMVVLGRESDLKNQLRSDAIRSYIKTNIRSKEIYDTAEFYIMHLKRDNTVDKFVIPVPELVRIDDWDEE